jgi:hypothetical protein
MSFMDACVVQRDRVLALLLKRGALGVTTAEVSDPTVGGHEGPRRIRELRELGWAIGAEPLGGHTGLWRYWLLAPGETPPQLDLLAGLDPAS